MLNEVEGERGVCVSEDGLCVYCRECPATSADHVRPAGARLLRSAAPSRLLPCCATCNSSKGKTELGLWMVNKFGFSTATVKRICDLEAPERHEAEETTHQKEASPTQRANLEQLRAICYDFCHRLHDHVLALRESGTPAELRRTASQNRGETFGPQQRPQTPLLPHTPKALTNLSTATSFA
jgi:hypothetical protein